MRTFITAVAMAAGISISLVPSALAADGGTSVVGSTPAAPVQTTAGSAGSGTTSGDLDTQTVSLTKSQTKSVQRRVSVPADGSLGSKTQKAIKRYQSKKDLTLTGKPNIETLRSMKLKIADKLEAKLIAAQSGTTTQTVALADPTSGALAALAAARTRIGDPYVSGGTKPGGFDCSGLTQWAFAQAGIKIPRTSFDQYGIGTAVPKAQIQAGDLVFFDSNGAGASHVGIATSPTSAISATSHGVMEHDISAGYWAGHYVGARRVTDAPAAVAARAAVK
ncbi:MAG: NlpC/P60 family protein [Solirubrobacteraceae bacterium]|nr:NlpC/P60 family protein [Patulibacter sp.]